MIKIENVSISGFEPAIRGMRNPKNSWDRSDSHRGLSGDEWSIDPGYIIGPNDKDLMMRLAAGGAVHAKYRRMIVVWLDITAPLFWWPEFDTYKVAVVRNSCSFMHKGTSKPYTIRDFDVKDERIYTVLDDLAVKTHTLHYPYETDIFKIYTAENGRQYKVYKNGRVVRMAFDYVDNYGSGRVRHFDEAPATIYQTKSGYCVVQMSGRYAGHIMLHRLVAELFCSKPSSATQVNHIDGDKGNNCAENLEWVTPKENVNKGMETGLFDNLHSVHHKYCCWKNASTLLSGMDRFSFYVDSCVQNMSLEQLAKKYGITKSQANNSRWIMRHSDNEELFQRCYAWDTVIEMLNGLREKYLETKDDKVFQEIRCLMPQGYLQRATVMLNYEVLAKIYKERRCHRLDEWREFCSWIETLPYSGVICGEEKP